MIILIIITNILIIIVINLIITGPDRVVDIDGSIHGNVDIGIIDHGAGAWSGVVGGVVGADGWRNQRMRVIVDGVVTELDRRRDVVAKVVVDEDVGVEVLVVVVLILAVTLFLLAVLLFVAVLLFNFLLINLFVFLLFFTLLFVFIGVVVIAVVFVVVVVLVFCPLVGTLRNKK